MGKITEDQKALMVKLYAAGKTTVQIGQYLQVSPTTFQVATAGYVAEKIAAFLYGNATVALDRKATAAAKIAAMRDVRLSAERARLTQIAGWYQDGEILETDRLASGCL